ncbi:FecR domain-containing protein [Galbibacter sp. EGI 63066]|uniref:FecR family protein n=1 Tax=Galbibacter sp. EGI 63066 TaxID=2993559 RepID=UPI00224928A2|nr:FecR domain-containing protein [Galbibacter sp. EGI 63066]MCX2682038.1 FecR domain-containing protein [Galbibacter sp. EGI 63066]
MKKDNFLKLLNSYVKGKSTSREKKQLQYFIDQVQKNGKDPDPERNTHDRIYSKIQNSILKKKKEQRIRKLRYFSYRTAAVLLCLVGMGFLFKMFASPKQITETALLGEKKEALLPDGSKVMLNAGSTLQYPEQFNAQTREVTLRGEAFFKVNRNEQYPFIVHSNGLDTRVLGTSFNIHAYPTSKNIKVSVATGKVKVSDGKHLDVLLTPDQEVVYNKIDSTFSKQKILSDNAIAWTQNVILLDGHSLKATAEILEKWFDVRITIDNTSMDEQKITGKYKNPKLKEVLESLEFLTNISYEFTQNNHIILKNSE